MALKSDYVAAVEAMKRAHRKLLVSSVLLGFLAGYAVAHRAIDRVVVLNYGQGIEA